VRLITRTSSLAALVALFVFAGADRCFADFTGLGAAGGYAVLGLDTPPPPGTPTQGTTIDASLVTITGNVGVSDMSTLKNAAPSKVIGDVYVAAGGTVNNSGTITGTIFTHSANFPQAVTDAFAANTAGAALMATQTFTASSINTAGKTITGNGGLNVIDITGDINLNNHNITLSGGASDIFVVNVTGNLDLVGTASLVLTGGLSTGNVLYNFTGGTSAHHGSFNTHIGDNVYGTMLAPYYDMNLDGNWYGELIGGPMTIGLLSNATVTNSASFPSFTLPVPEPSEFVALSAMSLVGLGGVFFFRRRAKSA
jgi:Ice-binding-like